MKKPLSAPSIVEKSLMVARTSVLHKMGREATKYSEELVQANSIAKNLEAYYSNLIKISKRLCDKTTKYPCICF